MGSRKNDAVSWLPGDAESTKVIDTAQVIRAKDEIPAIVVYERAAGVTPADLASVTSQVAKFNALAPVQRDPVGPIPSQDKKALQVAVPINAGSAGWAKLSAAVDEMRVIPETAPPASQHTSPGLAASPPTRPPRSPGSTASFSTRHCLSSSSSC